MTYPATSHVMWIVKLGGSLERGPAFTDWLDLLLEVGRGGTPIVIVPGGGVFADQARAAQARWAIDDVAAHNMAVLGMAQMAALMQGLRPALQAADDAAGLRACLQRGEVAVWRPIDLLRAQPDALTCWDVTADSLALWLAQRLSAPGFAAPRLLIVKACEIDRAASIEALGAAGVLDADFARRAREARLSIELLQQHELARARQLLSRTSA